MIKMLREITKKAIKFIVLLIAFIYIVSPIDLLPLNPLDDIIAGLIAFFIAFSDFDILDKLFEAEEKKKTIKQAKR